MIEQEELEEEGFSVGDNCSGVVYDPQDLAARAAALSVRKSVNQVLLTLNPKPQPRVPNPDP